MELIPGKKNEDVYTISFWVALGWMLVGPVLFLLAYSTMYHSKYGVNIDESDFLNGVIITELIGKVLPIAFGIYIFKKILKDDFVKLKKNWIKYILILVGSIVTLIGINYLIEWLYEVLKIKGVPSNQDYIETIFESRFKPVMFIIAVVVAPFFEELIFRKFLISYLKGKTNLPNYLIYAISAVVFAAIHIISNPADIVFFPMYFALSLTITMAYKFTDDNLYISSGVHFINNLLSFFQV